MMTLFGSMLYFHVFPYRSILLEIDPLYLYYLLCERLTPYLSKRDEQREPERDQRGLQAS